MTSKQELLDEIIDETIAFQRLPLDEKREFWRNCGPIPLFFRRANDRTILTNMKAMNAFKKLVGMLYRENSSLREQHSKETLESESYRAIGVLFDELAIADQSVHDQDYRRHVSSRFFDSLNVGLERTLVRHTRIVPCHVFSSAPEVAIRIGPVEFHPRGLWLKRAAHSTDWGTYVERVWNGELSAEDLESTAWKTAPEPKGAKEASEVVAAFGTMGWVATVDLERFDHKRSQLTADVIVDLALCILGFVMQPTDAANLASARDAQPRSRTWIALDVDGNISWTSSIRRLGVHSSKDSAERLLRNSQVEDFFNAAGRILQNYVENVSPDRAPMVERWINALDWYHQGLNERADHMSIVKYGCSLDIITGARGRLNEMYEFCELVFSRDVANASENNKELIKRILSDIYNRGRSPLAHGSKLGLLTNMGDARLNAQAVTRAVLIGAVNPISEMIRLTSNAQTSTRKETAAFKDFARNYLERSAGR